MLLRTRPYPANGGREYRWLDVLAVLVLYAGPLDRIDQSLALNRRLSGQPRPRTKAEGLKRLPDGISSVGERE